MAKDEFEMEKGNTKAETPKVKKKQLEKLIRAKKKKEIYRSKKTDTSITISKNSQKMKMPFLRRPLNKARNLLSNLFNQAFLDLEKRDI